MFKRLRAKKTEEVPRVPDNYVEIGSYLADREDFPNKEWADTGVYRVYVHVSPQPYYYRVGDEFGSVEKAATWAQENKGYSEDDWAVLPDGVPAHITESEVEQHRRARMER